MDEETEMLGERGRRENKLAPRVFFSLAGARRPDRRCSEGPAANLKAEATELTRNCRKAYDSDERRLKPRVSP